MEFAYLGISHLIAFGPDHSHQQLEHCEGEAQNPTGTLRDAAQKRRSEPRVGMPVREEPAIEDENATYFRPARRLATLQRAQAGVAGAPRQQSRKNQRRPALWTGQTNPARLPRRDRCVRPWNRHSPWAYRYRPCRHTRRRASASRPHSAETAEPSPIQTSHREIPAERNGVRRFALPPQENLERRVFRRNDSPGSGVVANTLSICEPSFGRRARVHGRSGDCTRAIRHIVSPDQSAFAASS